MLTSIFFVASVALAQVSVQAPELGDVALAQALLDLGNPYRLMCVAAHPDDEDGATLAYYRMKYGAETMALIATRGEGGQNEIGPELYEELAVIRTKEMQAAAKIEGAHLRFLDLPEFGFSKSIEETWEVWGEEETLRRMVREIRVFRPHVIITNHGRMKDHGHHQAIGAATLAAFDAAADETRFPESGEAWQVARLYIRDWEGGADSAAVPISELEPHRGKTYAEIAASALMEHKSQGMQQFIDQLLYERPVIFYDLVKEQTVQQGEASERDFGQLFAGVTSTGMSLALQNAAEDDPWERTPWESILRMGQHVLTAPDADLQGFLNETEQLLAIEEKVRLVARPLDAIVVPGQVVPVELTLESFGENANSATAQVFFARGQQEPRQRTLGSSGWQWIASGQPTELGEPVELLNGKKVLAQLQVPSDTKPTLPASQHLVHTDPSSKFSAFAYLEEPGPVLQLSVPLPVQVAVPFEVAFDDAPYLLSASGRVSIGVTVTNRQPGPAGTTLNLFAPAAWIKSPSAMSIIFLMEDEQRRVIFELKAPDQIAPGAYPFMAWVEGGEEIRSVVERVDVVIPRDSNIGVIPSYDNTFDLTLTRLDVPHAVLEPENLTPEGLANFTAVIVDIRAYRYRPGLAENNAALLEYVKRGGTLLVMYHKTFDWDPSYAPYPITLSNNRVTREDAPVEVLVPEHPLFNQPNKITAADWEGWLQERGLYFPSEWDAAYTPLIAMSDPGETIPPGSMLIAQYGEGTYLYTALGWYRQLRELHPGALRMFANMLNLKN